MTILYETTRLTGHYVVVAIVLFFITAVLIAAVVYCKHNGDSTYIMFIPTAVVLLILGVVCLFMKTKIIKATVNDTVPWIEINNKYELLDQEGDIYTFAVKEDKNELVQKEEN